MTRGRLLLITSFSLVGLGAAVALSTLVLGPAQAAVGPLPAEALALPADARVYAGFDVQRFVNSALYERVKAERGGDPFQDLREKAGIDPERDLERIVFAGGGPGRQGVAVALGRFDAAVLSRAVESGKGATAKRHAGATVYLFDESKKNPVALALVGKGALLIGSPAAVESTLANREKGASLATNKPLAGLLERVKPGSTFWLVADSRALESLPGTIPAPGGAESGATMALPPLQSVVLTGDLDPELALEAVAEAADEAAARNLGDLVRGGLALLSLQAAKKPELKGLASAVSVTSDGTRVLVSLRLPYDLLDTLRPRPRGERNEQPEPDPER